MNEIKINFQTGNSFGSHEETDFIEYQWENIEYAKESLRRIKNHYNFESNHRSCWTEPKDELPTGVIWDKEHRVIMLELVDDSGKPFKYSPFWVGYFETLHKAEIIATCSDMVFTP